MAVPDAPPAGSKVEPSRSKRVWLPIGVVLVATAIGVVVFLEIQARRKTAAALRAALEPDPFRLGPDNPPSPKSFFPYEAASRPPLVTGFKIVPADKAGDAVTDREHVLAVEINGQARAYPLNVMTGPEREVFNDTLGGRVIAATW